ncbi:MAG: DNA repair protein RecN [Chloroflexi bacterium]|nr:DNA repair protein RecN [Chloroflexota bacterium]
MLSQLTIRNFAIVDRLDIEWHAGLNVITGETGAGKSILLDAVGALLGDRLGPEMVRSGASRALVEGVFALPDSLPESLSATLDEFGIEPEDGALIVSREIAGSGGRGGARINGRGVPLSVLLALGEQLVDVHGQSEHMALLRPREQLDYLDRYASALPDRAEVGRLFRELRATRAAHQELLASERETARLQDMLRHEIAEIETAALRDDEEDELMRQRARLEHVERLRQAALTAVECLSGADDEQLGATDLLARAVAACHDAGRIDPTLDAEADALGSALAQAEESARTLRDYLESVEADPQGLERVTERLFQIGDLKRKFGESIPEILAYADAARGRLTEIDQRSERLDELAGRATDIELRLSVAAQALSSLREAAAARLSDAVQRELRDLRLADARFEVSIAPADVDVSGADRVEFRLGDEHRSMSRIASGGELARIALALKTVLSQAETRPSLVFDEIDVGVGGRTAPVVGQKLWTVAAAGHQVLCVTHMPQVAAFADSHYVVSRTAEGVCVTEVDGDQRLDELAAMLAGAVSNASRSSARELIGRAESTKLTSPSGRGRAKRG